MTGEQGATHPGPVSRPLLSACPACGAADLEPVAERDDDTVHYLCRNCRSCWSVAFNAVWRQAPHACSGCPHRPECVAAYVRDHPGAVSADRR
jgi:hypothetical protein